MLLRFNYVVIANIQKRGDILCVHLLFSNGLPRFGRKKLKFVIVNKRTYGTES